MIPRWIARAYIKASTFISKLHNFLPTSIEWFDFKKETMLSKSLSWWSRVTGLWKARVNKVLAKNDVVHVKYRYNNRTFTYVTTLPIKKWPPVSKEDLARPHGFDEHTSVLVALLVTRQGIQDVFDRFVMSLGPLHNFHGQNFRANELFPDMHPKGILVVQTFDGKHAFKADDLVRL
jgi:hypothetical protein